MNTPLQRSPEDTGLSRRQWLTGAAAACLGGGLVAVPAQAQELFDLDKVRASGILKVALYKDNAPYSDGKGQDMEGVDVALAQALATEMGLKLSLLPFDAGEKMNDDPSISRGMPLMKPSRIHTARGTLNNKCAMATAMCVSIRPSVV